MLLVLPCCCAGAWFYNRNKRAPLKQAAGAGAGASDEPAFSGVSPTQADAGAAEKLKLRVPQPAQPVQPQAQEVNADEPATSQGRRTPHSVPRMALAPQATGLAASASKDLRGAPAKGAASEASPAASPAAPAAAESASAKGAADAPAAAAAAAAAPTVAAVAAAPATLISIVNVHVVDSDDEGGDEGAAKGAAKGASDATTA